MMKGAAAGLLLFLTIAQLMAEPSLAMTCIDVDLCMAPCISFLTGKQAAPGDACCAGVRKLKAQAATTADRQFACGCMKAAAARMQDLKEDAANSLPRLCGTPVPFPISRQVDCTKVL